MRIGILTFHHAINHGAFLQAWSTYQHLLLQGHEVSIINYHNRRHLINEYRGLLIRYNPRNIIRNMRRIVSFWRDQRMFPLTPFTTRASDVAELPLDCVVFGSDIIWNFEMRYLGGGDPLYFGVGLESRRRVAYAPSFGPIPSSATVPDYLVRSLSGFDGLSVRDKNSQELLEKSIGRPVPIVVDPTLLYRGALPDRRLVMDGRYMLVYAFALRASEIEQAKAYARANGLSTVAVGYPQAWCDRQYLALGPFDWAAHFFGADAILTSTFHGTLFSIKAKKPFVTSNNKAIASKTVGLLQALGLEHRLSEGDGDLEKIWSECIDEKNLDGNLDRLVVRSVDYLTDAMA